MDMEELSVPSPIFTRVGAMFSDSRSLLDSRFKTQDSRLSRVSASIGSKRGGGSRLQSPVSSLSYSSRLQAPCSMLSSGSRLLCTAVDKSTARRKLVILSPSSVLAASAVVSTFTVDSSTHHIPSTSVPSSISHGPTISAVHAKVPYAVGISSVMSHIIPTANRAVTHSHPDGTFEERSFPTFNLPREADGTPSHECMPVHRISV